MVIRIVLKWINRRGGKKVSYKWLDSYLQWNPLPLPKIKFSVYAKSSSKEQNSCIEEPYAGNPHVGFCGGRHGY